MKWVPPAVLVALACAHAQTPQTFHLVGSAEFVGSVLRLTPAVLQTAGAAWFAEKQRVRGGFEVTFRFQLTGQGGLDNGADGLAFVLQNEGPDAMAGRGSAGGFAPGNGQGDSSSPGIPRAIAVFFDTHRNRDADDPNDNHVVICTNGPIGKMRWPPRRLGVAKLLNRRMKDGKPHTARIVYTPPLMAVYLDDDRPALRVPVDLSTVTDAEGAAYIGFTAATGAAYQNHDVLAWSFKRREDVSSAMFTVQSDIRFLPPSCLAGRNLCTPAEATVQTMDSGGFRVMLPAHIEWGASIANADGRGVTIENACGIVCIENEECGGPEGLTAQTSAKRADLLAPDRNPGALVTRSERGRTWFSVNGRRGRSFRDHQGFFEFDVKMQ